MTAVTGRNGGWTLLADVDLCQGHQMCVLDAPELFGFDEDADHVEILVEQPDDALRLQVDNAVQYCPAMALSVEEE